MLVWTLILQASAPGQVPQPLPIVLLIMARLAYVFAPYLQATTQYSCRTRVLQFRHSTTMLAQTHGPLSATLEPIPMIAIQRLFQTAPISTVCGRRTARPTIIRSSIKNGPQVAKPGIVPIRNLRPTEQIFSGPVGAIMTGNLALSTQLAPLHPGTSTLTPKPLSPPQRAPSRQVQCF